MEIALLLQSPPVTPDEMEHLTAQLSATHELRQQLLAQQERFEKSVNKWLSKIKESLGDLLVLSAHFPNFHQRLTLLNNISPRHPCLLPQWFLSHPSNLPLPLH